MWDKIPRFLESYSLLHRHRSFYLKPVSIKVKKKLMEIFEKIYYLIHGEINLRLEDIEFPRILMWIKVEQYPKVYKDEKFDFWIKKQKIKVI